MAAPQGTVRAREHDKTITFQVMGRATMTHSLPLRRYAEQGLAGGATALRVELRYCVYMDSTFLGTLLNLKRARGREGPVDFALVCPSPECCRLLHQTGVDDVFPVVTAEGLSATAWTELPCALEDVNACKRNVVQAHQELAGVPGPAAEPFRAVARCLAEAEERERSP